MKTADALAFFGKGLPVQLHRKKLAEAAGVTRQSVHRWIEIGYVPIQSALDLQLKSKGRCKINPAVYPQPKKD